MKKKVLSAALAASMALSMTPAAAFAAPGAEGHWAEGVLDEWMGYGVIKGYDDGSGVGPDNKVTRAEFVTMLDRVMGYKAKAENVYSDVALDWYTDYILKGVAAGVIEGDESGSTMRPNDPVSRQEACVILARVLGLDTESAPDAGFDDQASVADWAAGAVNAMRAEGYVNGSDGVFRPADPTTRAEAVKMLDNIFAGLYQESGEYSGDVDGSAVVSADGVDLKGQTIEGDLVIAEGVGDGHVELDGVTVEGRVIVRGGGVNSVIVKGASKIGEIVVDRQSDPVRVAVEGDAEVGTVTVAEDTVSLVLEGKVASVSVETPGVELSVAGEVETLTVAEEAEGAKVSVEEGAVVSSVVASAPKAELSVAGKVESVSVKGDSTVVIAEEGGSIFKAEISGAGSKVEGVGNVESVTVPEGSGSGIVVDTEGTKVENNSSSDVTVGGEVVKPGEAVEPEVPSTGGGGSSVPSTPDIKVLSGSASSLSGGVGSFEMPEGITLDLDNEIPEGLENRQFSQAQVTALGGSGDYRSLTMYVKIDSPVPEFDTINQYYRTDNGQNVTMANGKTNPKEWELEGSKLNKEDGRYAKDSEGNTYLKLSLYAFTKSDSSGAWELFAPDATKQVLSFEKEGKVVATLTIDSPLDDYSVASPVNEGSVVDVSTPAQLTEALTSENVGTIRVSGSLRDNESYSSYTVNHPVEIQGVPGNKVFGSFVVKADGVVFDGLNVQNGGQQTGLPAEHKNAINAYTKNITITNCEFDSGTGFANGVVIFPSDQNVSYTIKDNVFNNFDNSDDDWSTTGLSITGAYNMSLKPFFEVSDTCASTGSFDAMFDKSIIEANEFNGCAIDYVRNDWASTETVYAGLNYKAPLSGESPVVSGAKLYFSGDEVVSGTVPAGAEMIVLDGATTVAESTTLSIAEGATLSIAEGASVKGSSCDAMNSGKASLSVCEGGSVKIEGTEDGGLQTTVCKLDNTAGKTTALPIGTVIGSGKWNLSDKMRLNAFLPSFVGSSSDFSLTVSGSGVLNEYLVPDMYDGVGQAVKVGGEGEASYVLGEDGKVVLSFSQNDTKGIAFNVETSGAVSTGRDTVVEASKFGDYDFAENLIVGGTLTVKNSVVVRGVVEVAEGGSVVGSGSEARIILQDGGSFLGDNAVGTYVYSGGAWTTAAPEDSAEAATENA